MTSLDPNRLLQAYTRIAELEVQLEQTQKMLRDDCSMCGGNCPVPNCPIWTPPEQEKQI